MNQPSEELKTLTEIRDIMERSSRFLSLSGMSGIFAGIFALSGVIVTYLHYGLSFSSMDLYREAVSGNRGKEMEFYSFITLNGFTVLTASLAAGFYFTSRKAFKHGYKMWDQSAKRLAINLFIPLATGGIFCIALLSQYAISLLAPATLIFYGLALINASKYTLGEIRYLGICELTLGLIAAFLPGYGLLFWAVGFGMLHIVYGWKMYRKYDMQASVETEE